MGRVAYDLAGRTAIVTGGAGGIGRAVARRFAESGARVALWDSDSAGLAAALAEIGGHAASQAVDVSDEASVAAATDETQRRFGRIDVLVNGAGILGPVVPVWEISPGDFRRVVEINLVGAYLCARAVVPVMLAQARDPARGWIVNIASVQGKEGTALAGAYAAAKAGLIALTKSLGKELAREAIYVNCVTPTVVETAMAREIDEERRADLLSRIPMGRFLAPDEVAAMVTWLASADCSFSTGAAFDLSGGRATY